MEKRVQYLHRSSRFYMNDVGSVCSPFDTTGKECLLLLKPENHSSSPLVYNS